MSLAPRPNPGPTAPPRRRQAWPLRWWLIAFLFTICLLSFVGFFVGTIVIDDARYRAPVEVIAHVTAQREQWTDPAWQEALSQELLQRGVEITLTDMSGQLIYRSEPIPSPHRGPGSIVPPRYNWRWEEFREVLDEGMPVGTVRMAYGWNPIVDDRGVDWLSVLWSLVVVLGSAFLISGLGIWLLSRIFLTPLQHMAAAATKVQQGDLAFSFPPAKVREVGEVLDAFQRMADGLRESVGRQAAMEEERRFFLAAISHDLRTPLFSLRGRIEGIRDGLAHTPEQVHHYLRSALDRVTGMERLVADLFAYSQLSLVEPDSPRERIRLDDALDRAIEASAVAAEAKHVTIVTAKPDDLCWIDGDAHLLERAVENLLSNAIRHTPPDGTVEVGWHRHADEVTVWVADNGEGITPSALPHLFTPLYRSEPSRSRQTGGAGLGLVIARRAVEAHGGTLTAANRPEGGACFTIVLPTAPPRPRSRP